MAFVDFAAGAGKSIQDLLLERELEKLGVSPKQLLVQKAQNEQRTQARADQELALRGREYDQNQQRLNANDRSLQEQRIATQGEKAAETVPPNSIMTPSDPLAGKMNAAGLGGLLVQNTTLPSTQSTGTDLGRLYTRSVPSDNQVQSLTKLPTERQATLAQTAKDREQAHADAQAQLAETNALRKSTEENTNSYRNTVTSETSRHNKAMETRPAASSTVVVHGVDADGNPVVQVRPKTAGAEYPAAQNATTENRLTSAKSVVDTGNDIINSLRDPKIAAMLGPVMSRYNNVADFVGNPPPEFSKLAGQIESYSFANMGVHGMRANTGAEAIKSTLGLGRHTPESIIAALQGLNGFAGHLLENAHRPVGGGSGTKKTAEELLKQYGGGTP